MKALFRRSSSKIPSLEDIKSAAHLNSQADCKSAGDVAWMVVGGVVVLGALILVVQEIPAIVRELRIMRM